MLVECKHCGAPLDVPPKVAFTRCSYCDHVNRIRSAKTLMAETPSDWRPPPVWTPPKKKKAPSNIEYVHHTPAPVPAPKGVPIVVVVLGFALLLAVTAAVVFAVARWHFHEDEGPASLAAIRFTPGATAPLTFAGVLEPERSAERYGSSCRGHVPRQAHATIELERPTRVDLTTTTASEDLTMVLQLEDGTVHCDDDGGQGLNPRIAEILPPGTHRVWVGSYHSNRRPSFSLIARGEVLDAMPTAGVGIALDGPPSWGAVDLEGSVSALFHGDLSGTSPANQVAPHCVGHLSVAPQVTITLTEARPLRVLVAEAETDTVLLVRSDAGEVFCDDDSGAGLDAMVEQRFAAGTWRIWVGPLSASSSGRAALLVRDAPGPRPRGQTLEPGAAPALGTVNLDVPGFTDSFRGSPRTQIAADELVRGCAGRTGAAPDLILLDTVERQVGLRATPAAGLLVREATGILRCLPAEADLLLPPGGTHVWVRGSGRRSRPFELSLTLR